nr:hypothetical protein [Tanacetum cinerariifolium]
MGKFRETLAEGKEGALHLGPEQDRDFADLSPEEKDRYKGDILAINILLQGLPKDIYPLINHYTNAKDIWDNMKMILEGSELTKDDRESKVYYLNTSVRTKKKLFTATMSGRFVTVVKLNRGLKESNYDHLYASLKQHELHANESKMMLHHYNQRAIDPLALENGVVLDEEQLLFIAGRQENSFDNDVDEPPVQDLALTVDNILQADQSDPIYDEAGPSYDSNILSEVQDHDDYIDNVTEYHEYVKDNAKQVVQGNVSSVPNDALMKIINDMHEQAAQCVSANE